VVIAVAGRRIDAAHAKVLRFPLHNVPIVERRLGELFEREAATALVGSAACGADLVALRVAGVRGMRRRIVLPFSRDEFRATSVADRPGDWGPVYDRVLAELVPTRDVIILEGRSKENDPYLAANEVILHNAATLARESNAKVLAVLVWEGAPRAADDVTAAFGDEACRRGWRVEEVRTL
jgi:hypothetical protein